MDKIYEVKIAGEQKWTETSASKLLFFLLPMGLVSAYRMKFIAPGTGIPSESIVEIPNRLKGETLNLFPSRPLP